MVCRSFIVIAIPRCFVSLPIVSCCVQLALLSSCLVIVIPPCPPHEQLLAAVVPGAEVVVVSVLSRFWGCSVIVVVSSTN